MSDKKVRTPEEWREFFARVSEACKAHRLSLPLHGRGLVGTHQLAMRTDVFFDHANYVGGSAATPRSYRGILIVDGGSIQEEFEIRSV